MPLNIDWQQILLHLLNFTILAAGLYFLLYSPVKKYMQKRKDAYIETDSKAAEKLKAASELEAQREKLLNETDAEIAQKRQDAETALREHNDAVISSTREEAGRVLRKAEETAKKERALLLDKAQSEIGEIIVKAAEKLLLGSSEEEICEHFLSVTEKDQKDG